MSGMPDYWKVGPWAAKKWKMDHYWGQEEAYPIIKRHVDHSNNLFTDAHRLRVKTVYHKLLREASRNPSLGSGFYGKSNPNWTYPEWAAKIRYKFEENRYMTSPTRVGELVAKAEFMVYQREFAEPYLKNPYCPTGNAWGRYITLPEHLLDPEAHHPLPEKEWPE